MEGISLSSCTEWEKGETVEIWIICSLVLRIQESWMKFDMHVAGILKKNMKFKRFASMKNTLYLVEPTWIDASEIWCWLD